MSTKKRSTPATNVVKQREVAVTRQPETFAVSAQFSAPAGYKVTKQLILPAYLLKVGEPKIFLVTGKMEKSTYIDPDPAKRKDTPMTLCAVGDCHTSEHLRLIVPAVVESTWRELYPNEEYVGKTFALEKLEKRAGKRYHDVRMYELERVIPVERQLDYAEQA